MNPPTFHNYDQSHIAILLLTIAVPVALALLAQKSKSTAITQFICFALALLLIGNYAAEMGVLLSAWPLDFRHCLPMQLCDWALFVTVAALITRNVYCFELAYFWGLGGTLQALITPNLTTGFPSFRFISFFITHSGIVVGILFILMTLRMRPRLGSLFRALLWSEFYLICALTVNSLTGGNYGFLSHKPEGASLLDMMSVSRPLYILEINLVAVVLMACLYVPFMIHYAIQSQALSFEAESD